DRQSRAARRLRPGGSHHPGPCPEGGGAGGRRAADQGAADAAGDRGADRNFPRDGLARAERLHPSRAAADAGKEGAAPLAGLAEGGGRGVEIRPRMYRVSKQLWFCSAHQVRLSETQCEALHGHNYRVLVYAEAKELDRASYVLDFAELNKAAVEICGRCAHLNINDVETD